MEEKNLFMQSGLAAVHAAANQLNNTDADFLSVSEINKEKENMTLTKNEETAAKTCASVAELKEQYPALVAEVAKESADSERARILKIEEMALPGQDALVKEMKADASVTPEAAAMRMIELEKTKRNSKAQAIKDIESFKDLPASAAFSETVEAAKTPSVVTPENAADAWDKNPSLQKEFTSREAYVAYVKAEADGKVKILTRK